MVETGTCQRLTSLADSKESSLLFEDLPQDFGTGTSVQQQDIPLRSIHGFAAQIWSKLPWMIGMLFFWHHHEMFLDSGKKLQESDYRVCSGIKNSIEIPSGQGSLAASGTWQWIDNVSHIRYPLHVSEFSGPTYLSFWKRSPCSSGNARLTGWRPSDWEGGRCCWLARIHHRFPVTLIFAWCTTES